MWHYWRKLRPLAAILVLMALSACQTIMPTQRLDVVVDGGETLSFGMNERGVLPADNGTYRVEQLGLMLYQATDTSVLYAWDFRLNVAASLPKSIRISQVLANGSLQTVLLDDEVVQKNDAIWQDLSSGGRRLLAAQRWHAVSDGELVTQAPWLQDASTASLRVFKIEIIDQNGQQHVLYQPMMVSADNKQHYVRVINALKKTPA